MQEKGQKLGTDKEYNFDEPDLMERHGEDAIAAEIGQLDDDGASTGGSEIL